MARPQCPFALRQEPEPRLHRLSSTSGDEFVSAHCSRASARGYVTYPKGRLGCLCFRQDFYVWACSIAACLPSGFRGRAWLMRFFVTECASCRRDALSIRVIQTGIFPVTCRRWTAPCCVQRNSRHCSPAPSVRTDIEGKDLPTARSTPHLFHCRQPGACGSLQHPCWASRGR